MELDYSKMYVPRDRLTLLITLAPSHLYIFFIYFFFELTDFNFYNLPILIQALRYAVDIS